MGSWGEDKSGLPALQTNLTSPFLKFCLQSWWTNRLNSAGLELQTLPDITRCGWSFELLHRVLKATHLLWLCWWALAFCPLITLILAVFMRPMPGPRYTVCTEMALCFWDFTGKIYLCYHTFFFFLDPPHTKPFVFLPPAWTSPSHLGFSCIKRWHHSPNCFQMRPSLSFPSIFHFAASARPAHARARADNQKRCMMSCRRSIRARACDRFSRKPIILLPFPSPSCFSFPSAWTSCCLRDSSQTHRLLETTGQRCLVWASLFSQTQ